MDISQMNVEIAVFLRRLRMYGNQKNVQVDEKTAELLLDVVLKIDKLITNAEMVPTTNNNSIDFIFDLNEQHFDLRQYLMCRLCLDQIAISKDDFEAHLIRKAEVHNLLTRTQHQTNGDDRKMSVIEHELLDTETTLHDTTMDSGYNGHSTTNKGKLNSESVNAFTTESYVKIDTDPVVVDQQKLVKNKDQSIPFACEYLIRANGFPWIATKEDILKFFDGIEIVNGVNGIHFIINKTKNILNEAIIELASEKDYYLALNRNKDRMAYSTIRIFQNPDVIEFLNLVTNSTYPKEQQVLRLENLSPKCTADDIKQYFQGRSILNVHFAQNNWGRPSGVAFVVFASSADIENALQNMDKGKMIQGTIIKAFRSSEEQCQHYCGTEVKKASNIPSPVILSSRSKSISNLSSKKKDIHNSTISLVTPNKLFEICARGIPWDATQSNVAAFFNGVNIVGDSKGIQMGRTFDRGPMEATFFVNTKDDLSKALACNKKTLNSRKIRDKMKSQINTDDVE